MYTFIAHGRGNPLCQCWSHTIHMPTVHIWSLTVPWSLPRRLELLTPYQHGICCMTYRGTCSFGNVCLILSVGLIQCYAFLLIRMNESWIHFRRFFIQILYVVNQFCHYVLPAKSFVDFSYFQRQKLVLLKWLGTCIWLNILCCSYILEQSLSVDNLFVFVLVFKYFRVPVKFQVVWFVFFPFSHGLCLTLWC